jgi:long-chain acyl-CoA synthetase
MNLARILADRAAEHPGRSALLFEGDVLSYGELDRRAAAAAAGLRAAGVGVGDRVAIRLPNAPGYVAAYFGALRAGAVAVPLNVLLAPPEVEARIAASNPVTIVDRPLPVEGAPTADPVELDDGETAALLFTSGTTGRPKGAVLTHGGIRAAGEFGAEALGLDAADVVFAVAPFPHVLGQQVLVSTFLVGAAVSIMQRFEAEAALATMSATKTTVLFAVPAMCISLGQAAAGAAELPPLRLAHVGGAPVPEEVAREFEQTFGARVADGYGLTELSGLATTFAVGRQRKPGSVGQPSPATEVRIVDADERGVGEVQFRGPSVVRHTWTDPDSPAAATDGEGWLATGDLGYLDEEGDLFLVDRRKEMIIRGGYNVYPREVEDALYAHPAVLEAAVVGVPHDVLGEDVAAFVVLRPGMSVTPEELQAWTKERVAAYKYPRHVVLLDGLPKGPTGKILKRSIDLTVLAPGQA